MKDVYSKSFTSVREDDTLSHCLSLLEKDKRRVLVVLDNEGKYKGVLARRWIIRSMLDPSTTKVKTLMRSAPTVTLDDPLSKVARLIIESGVMQLPVCREQELLGCVTDEDVIHSAVVEIWGNTKVEAMMTREPFVVEKDEPVGTVFNLFREHGISHAPIVSNGKLVGIISIHDIIKHFYEQMERVPRKEVIEKINVLTVPVRVLMIKPVITVLASTRLKIAEEQMRKFNVSSLVVVRKGKPEGIVTKRDFLEPIAQIETTEPRLRVQFSAKDVEIDGMQREFLRGEFDSFTRKFGETLNDGILFVYVKSHGTHYNGKQLLHCRFQLRSTKGSFFSSSEGWDIEQIFRLALHRLEIQILRSKETERHPELARTYLQRINFPSAEL
ncbi:MAG: CBS domain-containing protein [Candidatus Bathyarchaeia archaeon]